MTLIKTSILSLIATFFKMLSGLVINKAVSVYIGPSGLALIGQFQNFLQIALITAQGAINSGVVKYTAEFSDNKKKLHSLLSTALKISLTTSLLSSIILIIFSNYFSIIVFNSRDYQNLFILFGVTITFFVINGLILSIINGLKEINLYIKINIYQSIFSLFFTSILIYYYNLSGALSALATSQSVVFLIIIYLLKKHNIIKPSNFRKKFDSVIFKKLLSFSAMAIVSAILVPSTQFIIRYYISETQGTIQAGYWQGVWYISMMYLMIITTALSTYYLPRLSEIKNITELKKEIINGYKVLLPLVLILGLLIYICRDLIISLLFSSSFLDMKPLFIWQIIGDIFKISSWILAYIMIAKAMTITYIVTEIIFNISLVIITLIMTYKYGTIGATYSYAINYAFYLVTMISIFSIILKRKNI